MKLLHPTEIHNLADDELTNLHGRLHAYYTDLTAGVRDYNRENIVNQHFFVYEELRNRDMKHKILDVLDEETMRLGKIFLSLPADDSLQEELIMLDEEFGKAIASPSDWSGEEFAQPHGMPGIYLTPPHGRLLAEKKKTLIIKSVKFTKYTGTPVIVVSGKKAYGEIILKPPIEINLDEFDDLRDQHRITNAEYNRWWEGKRKLYAYQFSIQKIYDQPIKVDIPPGIQTFIQSIQKRISPELQDALDNLQDIVIVPDFISISGRTVIDEPSNDIDFIWRAKFDEDDKLTLQLREFLMKFTRSFPGELQTEFHHIGSPSGAAWNYKPIADLVLRFKDKPIVEIEDDSYAYHKIGKQAADTINFRIIGKMRKSLRFGTLEIVPPEKTLERKEALELYQKLNRKSNMWMLRLAVDDASKIIPIETSDLLTESDLELRWNADIRQPEWQGLDDPDLWEMHEGFSHRKPDEYGYWATFSKQFENPPTLGAVIKINPARLLKFVGIDSEWHYTWLYPTIRQELTDEKVDKISNLENRKLIEERYEVLKSADQIGKVFEDVKCWVACFPKDKSLLQKLQKELGLKINEQSGEGGLHLTLAVFNSLSNIEKIREIVAKHKVDEFVFKPMILDAFGDEAQVVVLRGTVPETIYEFANRLRSMKSAITDHEFSPHITLGEIDKAKNLEQDFAGVEIEVGAPVFMVSIPDKIEKRYSFSRCMQCKRPPEYDVLWGEGRAHAWFCKDCFAEWLDSVEHSGGWDDVDSVKEVQDNKAASSFGDNTNANIKYRLKDELTKSDKDFKIKLMEPFKPVKSASGYHVNEFTANQDEDLMFDTWAKGYLE